MRAAITLQTSAMRRSPLVTIALAVTVASVLYVGYRHGELVQATAYLMAMYICALMVDTWAVSQRHPPEPLPIRRPVREAIMYVVFTALGIAAICARFLAYENWETAAGGLGKLAVVAGIKLFTFPVALGAAMLLMRYWPRSLGFRTTGWWMAFPVIGITAITARIVAPDSFTLLISMKESGGFWLDMFYGFIAAGLSEEFPRLIGQTRLGAALRNRGWGWILATAVWAGLHAPKWYADDRDGLEAALSVLRIVPLGLLWGYLTHRTRSLLPATLVHGSNVWGLQNF